LSISFSCSFTQQFVLTAFLPIRKEILISCYANVQQHCQSAGMVGDEFVLLCSPCLITWAECYHASSTAHCGRADSVRAPLRVVAPVMPETQEAELRPMEQADPEAKGKKKPGDAVEAEDDVELDDESLDDATLIEASDEEDTDVTEIIGGDILKRKKPERVGWPPILTSARRRAWKARLLS
jgi:hypothetical protein